MACDLTVKAPNGKPSILYADLLSITNDAELAARIYIDTQTAKSKEQFKGKSMDENGEPLLDNVDISKFGISAVKFANISDIVDYSLKITNILSSDKAKEMFAKGNKVGWDLNKILTELGVPKEQKLFALESGIKDREELIIDINSRYGYEIKVKTATTAPRQYKQEYFGEIPEYNELEYENREDYNNQIADLKKEQEEFEQDELPTSHYSNLTQPGGTNYTENEISIPLITPSIKGHAQFSTNNGIGWFRSDDRMLNRDEKPIADSWTTINNPNIVIEEGTQTKTRRVLELQSDLFQKGRDKDNLVIGNVTSYNNKEVIYPGFGGKFRANKNNNNDVIIEWDQAEGKWIIFSNDMLKTTEKVPFKEFMVKAFDIVKKDSTNNQFLQLLNKDNNWVTFFVKSIIQDSVKKGYEKVVFPSGETAARIEGHNTLVEEIKKIDDRILEHRKWLVGIKEGSDTEIERLEKIEELEKEKQNIKDTGIEKLKPIEAFYEIRIANILDKIYGKDNVIDVTDEYGNTWREITLNENRDTTPILLATISDTVEDFNLTINTSNNYLYGFTVDEENYGINIGGSLALDHIKTIKHLTLEQATEQGDVKDKVVGWIRQISNYNFKNSKLTPTQHELNNKLADEIEKENSILWDKVKLDIKLNAGLKIKDLDEFEYDPNNVSNTWVDNQQFLVKIEKRVSTEVKNLINNTVDQEQRIQRLGGLPTKLRALNVLPHFVQNLYDAISKQDMLDKLKVLSKVNKSYNSIHTALSKDENLANAFFRDIKSSGELRVFLTINGKEDNSSFKSGIRNTNSFMKYQLSDLWFNTMDTKRTSNFYKDSGILDEINTAYNNYKNPSQEDIVKHGNSIAAVKLYNLVQFLNKVGININDNILNDYVTDSNNRTVLNPNGGSEAIYRNSPNPKEDYAVYNLLELLDKNTTTNIHKFVNGIDKTFEGKADLMRLADQFKIWFEPGSIAYNNIENHTEQTYNKPTWLSDWMDTMRNDETFLIHLKNLIRPKAARYSNWLIKTKDHNGFLLLPEGTTIEDLDSTIKQVTLNKSFYLEDNGDLKFNAVFNEGIRNSDTGQNSRYPDIGDTDWVYTNIANYINGNRYTAKSNAKSIEAGEYALYSLLNPSDRGNNRNVSAPRIRLKKDELVTVESSGITNKNIGIARTSVIHKAVYNIFRGELQRIVDAKNAIYTLNSDMNREYTPDEKLVREYHYKVIDGKIVKEQDGKYIGDAFKFHNFSYTYNNKTYNLNDLFNTTPDLSILNNKETIEAMHTFIDRMLARSIQQERTKTSNIHSYITKVAKLLNQSYDEAIAEYTVNRYIANVEMTNLFLGDIAFYGNTLSANKRAGEVITSGIIGGLYGTEETFNGATINDRVIKNASFVKNIDKMLRHLKVQDNVREFIVNSYNEIDTTDGISYITLEEFSKRTTNFGTNNQYKSLIDKLNNPDYTITVDDLTEVIQAQKDFYYSLDYDPYLNLMIPNQVKNSEFVLIPKLLGENSQLKALYDAMIKTGNSQLNVQQAEKVGTRYVANISDDEGNLIEGFENELIKATRPYYYKNLRKQQDIVDHIQDEDNSRGVQLDKLIMTNVSDEKTIKEIFDINIANITESSIELQKELGITNTDGVWSVDLKKFATVIKKSYIEDGANSNYVFGAELDENTNTFKLPLDTPINRKKNESLINSMFSRNVINQKHPGVHGPQISNAFFDEMVTKTGVKKFSQLPTDKRLEMTHWEVTKEGVKYYKMQVLLPAWSKKFFSNDNNITIEDLKAAGLDTMLGYRIPSEDKHSMFIFEVVGFLDSSQGSSMVVPDGFTVQTGSDFDIDSIYTMHYNFNIDKEGKIYKTKYYKTNEQIWDNHYQKAIDILEDLTKTKDTFESDNEVISKLLGNMLGILPEQYTDEELDTAFKEKKEGYSLDLYNKLKVKVDSFPTKEEFMNRDIATNNTKKARQNRTLELYIDILTSPEHYLETVSPNTTEDTNNAKSLAESYYNKYNGLSNYNMPSTQDSLRELSLNSRDLKGISVNRDGFLAIAQRINLRLKDSKLKVKFNIIEDITVKVNDKDITIPKYTIEKLKEYFGEDNVQEDGTVTLTQFGRNAKNGFFNIDGRLITSYAAQSTQHILDSVKFPLPYGVTENSLNDWRLLVDMGASWNIATLLINQSAINKVNVSANNKTQLTLKERGRAIASNRKKFLDDIFIQMLASDDPRLESLKTMDKYNEAVASINKNKTFIDYSITNALHDILATDIVIGDQFLIDQLKTFVKYKTLNSNDKTQYLIDQLNILDYYENMVKVNNQINDFQKLTSFDKSKVGPEFSDISDTYNLYDRVQTDGYNNKLVTDTNEHYIDAIYKGEAYPALKAYKEMGIDVVYKAFNSLFLNQSPSVSSLLSQYSTDIKPQVLNYVYAYNLRTLPFFNNTDITTLFGLNNQSIKGIDITKVTKENLDTFNALSFVNKLMVFKEQSKDYIRDTDLLHYVKPIYGEAYIKANGRGSIEFVSDKPDDFFIQSFKTLWYNDNPFLHLLMKDMVKFAFFDTGLTFGRNISKVIPAEILYNEPVEIENTHYTTFSEYPVTKGIGFTSYMNKQRLLHFNNDYIDMYDQNFKIKFARSNWDRNNIVPRVENNMEEDKQAFKNTGRTEYIPKYNTIFWNTDGVIKVTKAQFNSLSPLQQKADVVRKNRKIDSKDVVKLFAKIRATNSNEFAYYYVPVNKLDSFEFEQNSRIAAYNDLSVLPFDDYLLELGMVERINSIDETNVDNTNIEDKIDISNSTKKSIYFKKDRIKFNKANKLISRGSENSSSESYRIAVGNKANVGEYTNNDIVGISAEGNRTNRIKPDFEEIKKAINANVIFITDNITDRTRDYNIGEREVTKFLTDNGYKEVESGKWINTITENSNTIYNKLGTKTANDNVIIDNIAGRKPSTSKGIVAYRTRGNDFLEAFNKDRTIGNPWSHAGYGLYKTNTVKEAVIEFTKWLTGEDHTNVLEDYRKDILDNLDNLKGKKIIYYQELGEPSHATVLDYIINKYNWNNKIDNKSDGTQLSLFANIDDSPDSFADYNQALLKFHRSILSDYTNRLQNAPSKLLEETVKKLKAITWGDNLNSAIHASFRANFKYTNTVIKQLEKMFYSETGYTNKDVFADIMSDPNKIIAFEKKLNFTTIFLKGFAKMNNLEPYRGDNLTKEQEDINKDINRLLLFNTKINKLKTTVDTLRRSMFEHMLPSYSTNPDINLGEGLHIRNMFDAQHDETWSQLFLAAMSDTHNIFLANYLKKYRLDSFEKEQDNKKRTREYNDKIEEFRKSGRTINDLIDKDNKLIQEFDEKYKEDYEDYIDKLKETELKHTKYSKEYYTLNKEYQKWRIDNILDDNTDEVRLANFNANDILLKNFEASKLIDDIRDRRSLISNNIQGIDDYSEISQEDIDALKKLKDEEDLLANVYDINTGELKTGKDLEIAKTISEYKKAISDILSKYYIPVINNTLYKTEYNKHLKGTSKADLDWLARNTITKFSNTFWANYSQYAEILGRDETEKLTSILSIYKDRNGVVNGNLVNDFIKSKLKEATLEKYVDVDDQINPKGFIKPKRDSIYSKDYETRMNNKGDDTRDTDKTILRYKKEISDILNKYLKEDGTLDTVNISIDNMNNLNTLYNKVKLDSSYGHTISKMRAMFNKWYNEIHNPIFATKEFKEADKIAKTRGTNYYNKWKKLNTELYYTPEYYKLLESIGNKHFGTSNIVNAKEIDNINIDAIRELYKVDSFNDLPDDIKRKIINNSDIHYNGISDNGIVYTLADYLDLHTNPRNKTAFAFTNKEFAAKEVKRLYDAIINKDPKYIKLIKEYKKSYLYQNDIDDINNITTTLEYKELLAKYGEDSQWYNDNHTINYKGEIVPLSYWTTTRPKDSKLFKENNPTKKFWSYNEMTNPKYIDARKTGARKWMNENVDYITTPYYNETSAKLKEILSEEDYNKWFNDNHYYNPYTHTYQPISSWTMMSTNKDNILEHQPIQEMLDQEIKDEFNTNNTNDPLRSINNKPLPKKSSKYYYDNRSNKNARFRTYDDVKADPLYKYITELLEELMQHYSKDTIINEQGLPIMHKANINNTEEAGKFLLKKAGWHDVTNHDIKVGENSEKIHILNMPYLSKLIKQEELEKPIEKEFPTREAYLTRYNEVVAANKEIRAKNAEYQKAHLDNDFESVIRQFIGAALDNKFKYEHEDETRLILEEISNLDMIKKQGLLKNLRNNTREKLSKTRPELFNDDPMLATEKGVNSNLEKHFRAFLEMVFYGDFEADEGIYTNIARVMQNFTSARGLWLNAPAGVNNVVQGQTQMGLEAAAGYYFNQANANKAHVQYTKALISIMADTGHDKASTFISGILKYFDIVELQDEVAITTNKELNKGLLKHLLNSNTMFILQNSGEHFLQNNGLLAMLDSHRIVGNKIQSFVDYTQDKHYKALQNILNVKGKKDLDSFIKNNKNKDVYINGKRNLIREFILTSDSGIQQEYLKELDKITKDAKKTFAELPKAIDVFDFKDGYITIKEKYNSTINNRVIGEFKTKVLKANQKMQGVYNSFDAGTGQTGAIFRLVSQFKLKWMYPGFTKRFGTRPGSTFWNEGRSEEDTGMYVSTWRFLTKPIGDAKIAAKENNTSIAIGNIFKDYGKYISNIGVHWNSLTDTDKANIIRTATEGLEFASIALMLWIAKGMAKGDDDDKKKWAYTLYTLDRLKTETLTFSPYGVVNEGRKFIANPFAAMSMLDDIGKLMYVTLFEQDTTYKGGIYHGESKVHVQLFKNIPLFNRYLRYENIEDYAGYYKLY